MMNEEEASYWQHANHLYAQYSEGKLTRETYDRRLRDWKEKAWPTCWGNTSKKGPSVHHRELRELNRPPCYSSVCIPA
jgi:hypothetical protein